MSRLAQIESIKDLIQDGIDRTVQGVESIHQNILDFPFAVIESKEDPEAEPNAFNQRVKQARQAKTRAVSSIYGLIRQINSDVGELVSDLIGSVEDHTASEDAAADASETLVTEPQA